MPIIYLTKNNQINYDSCDFIIINMKLFQSAKTKFEFILELNKPQNTHTKITQTLTTIKINGKHTNI